MNDQEQLEETQKGQNKSNSNPFGIIGNIIIIFLVVSIIYLIYDTVFVDSSQIPGKYILQIKSNTEWTGFFVDRTIEGINNQDIILPVAETGIYCCNIQKKSEEGYLKAFLYKDNILIKSNETTAKYGVILICNN